MDGSMPATIEEKYLGRPKVVYAAYQCSPNGCNSIVLGRPSATVHPVAIASLVPAMLAGLATNFGLVGALVGRFPCSCIFITTLTVLLLSSPLLLIKPRLRLGLNAGGFTPINAPHHAEVRAQMGFFNATGEAWYMALFGLATQPDGNMINEAEFEEFESFYRRVTAKQMSLPVVSDNSAGDNFTFRDFCAPLCDINDQMGKLMENQFFASLRWPVSHVLIYDVNIGKHVFNRSVNARGELVGAKIMAYYFTAFVPNEGTRRKLESFEKEVSREVAQYNTLRGPNASVTLISHGSNGVVEEIRRGIFESLGHFAKGFLLAQFVFLFLHLFSGCLQRSPQPLRRVILAVHSLFVAIASLLSATGVMLLAGIPINLLFITAPFPLLISALNAHCSFQLADTWARMLSESRRKRYTSAERLAATFEAAAPAFLTLHCTLVMALLGSVAVLFGNYANLALFVGLALTFHLLYEVFLFAPLMALCCADQEEENYDKVLDELMHLHHKKPSIQNGLDGELPRKPIIRLPGRATRELYVVQQKEKKVQRKKNRSAASKLRWANHLTGLYANWLVHSPWAKLLLAAVVLSVSLLAWWSPWCGLPRLTNRMDYRRLLPANSPTFQGFDLMDSIWVDWLQIVYIIERPPDFEQEEEYAEFKAFVTAATSIPHTMQPSAHQSWIFDYYRDKLNEDFFTSTTQTVNMSHFNDFISTFPYKAWRSGVHYHNNAVRKATEFSLHTRPAIYNKTVIDKMLVMIAYNATYGLNGKHQLLKECRRVAAHYPHFSIRSFDTDSETVDIIDNVGGVAWKWLMALLLACAVVHQAMLWDVAVTVLATVSAGGIVGSFIGFAPLAGFELDLLTLPSTMCLAAYTVYASMSFLGEYLNCWAKDGRLRRALQATGGPLIKTTLLVLLPAAFQLLSTVEFFALQARLQLIGVGLSLLTSLFLLPMIVGIIPERCLARS